MQRNSEGPLRGRRIWITRPEGQADSLAERVRAGAGEPVSLPVVEISGNRISQKQQRLLAGLAPGDIVIFISRNAVRYLGAAITEPVARFKGVQVLAVGSGTREALVQAGFSGVVAPQHGSGSEALLQLGLLQEAQVRGRRVVIFRGSGGRELLQDTLLQRGASVEVVELYQRRKPRTGAAGIKNLWHRSPPDVIVITSGEGLKNLIDITPQELREELFHTRLVVISDRVRDLALASGFRLEPRVAADAGDAELMQAISSLYRGSNT